MPRLFHVSEESDIELFEPRPSSLFPYLGSVVWAITESHVANYLLPRDCPRVTFCSRPTTTTADSQRFGLTDGVRVIVVESEWLDHIRKTALYLYRLPAENFAPHDTSAGYWLSRQTVRPAEVTVIRDLIGAIAQYGGEIRTQDSLWQLQDDVVSSTLDFSIIRMRNARKPESSDNRKTEN